MPWSSCTIPIILLLWRFCVLKIHWHETKIVDLDITTSVVVFYRRTKELGVLIDYPATDNHLSSRLARVPGDLHYQVINLAAVGYLRRLICEPEDIGIKNYLPSVFIKIGSFSLNLHLSGIACCKHFSWIIQMC